MSKEDMREIRSPSFDVLLAEEQETRLSLHPPKTLTSVALDVVPRLLLAVPKNCLPQRRGTAL